MKKFSLLFTFVLALLILDSSAFANDCVPEFIQKGGQYRVDGLVGGRLEILEIGRQCWVKVKSLPSVGKQGGQISWINFALVAKIESDQPDRAGSDSKTERQKKPSALDKLLREGAQEKGAGMGQFGKNQGK
jgi:hypothetical protein